MIPIGRHARRRLLRDPLELGKSRSDRVQIVLTTGLPDTLPFARPMVGRGHIENIVPHVQLEVRTWIDRLGTAAATSVAGIDRLSRLRVHRGTFAWAPVRSTTVPRAGRRPGISPGRGGHDGRPLVLALRHHAILLLMLTLAPEGTMALEEAALFLLHRFVLILHVGHHAVALDGRLLAAWRLLAGE